MGWHAHARIWMGTAWGEGEEPSEAMPLSRSASGRLCTDSDGYLDVLVGNDGANELHRGKGNGLFDAVTDTPIARGLADTRTVAFVDVDGDGDLDAIACNFLTPTELLLNLGSLGWQALEFAAFNVKATSMAFADFDNDGDEDAMFAVYDDSYMLLRNVGAGRYESIRTPIGRWTAETYAVALGDYDADGDLDIFVCNSGESGKHNELYRNMGGGVFVPVEGSPISDGNGYAAAWADLDGDGDLDVVVGGGFGPNVLYWNEGGAFTLVNSTPITTSNPSGITLRMALADYDSDGDLDLLVANVFGANDFYRNEGNGVFTAVTDTPLTASEANTYDIAWGDCACGTASNPTPS